MKNNKKPNRENKDVAFQRALTAISSVPPVSPLAIRKSSDSQASNQSRGGNNNKNGKDNKSRDRASISTPLAATNPNPLAISQTPTTTTATATAPSLSEDLTPEQRQKKFINKVVTKENKQGEKKIKNNFGTKDVNKALELGFNADDINTFLKTSGITPKNGDFAVGGFNKTTRYSDKIEQGVKNPKLKGLMADVYDKGWKQTVDTPYYKYLGSSTATPRPTPTPRDDTESTDSGTGDGTDVSTGTVSNPAASMPRTPLMDYRVNADSLGIRPRLSGARRSGAVNRGTSRLSIPRSSGYSSLNLGM